MTSDPLDEDMKTLAAAMSEATPAPDAARRAANLALAEKNFAALQGSQAAGRQTSQTAPKPGLLRGVLTMLTTRSAAAGLTATTALVAVGILFLGPQGQQALQPPSLELQIPSAIDNAQAPAPELPAQEAETAEVRQDDTSPPSPAPRVEPARTEADAPIIADALATTLAESEGRAMAVPSAEQRQRISGGLFEDRFATVPEPSREEYANAEASRLQVTADNPVSTFSIDVDTASYALMRSSLSRGVLPAPESVRIEELINYFDYAYPAPTEEDISPFRPTVNVFETPWNPDTQLVHIGLQGELPAIDDRPPLNLVFLIDTSGSMQDASKLPLLIQSFRLMLDRLEPDDQVAIVTYAGTAGVALEPTQARDRGAINAALTALQAGGSTNGVGGLETAYDLAASMSDEGEVSRVLLATDGDFNVGISDPEALTDYIARQRESGTYLSVLGFGRGNLQDDTMQALAQNGNGTAAYIDTLHETQRVLVDQLAGALFPIADDVKVQVEFNPTLIAEYRLIGYETRALAREDFNNDAVDAGELGAGHSVTAIYEVTPVGSPAIRNSPLRYAAAAPAADTGNDGELGFLQLRWKEPGDDVSQLASIPILAATESTPIALQEARFAAAIAGFGEVLRGSNYLESWSYSDAIALANENRGADSFGTRAEAVQLMRLAESLDQ